MRSSELAALAGVTVRTLRHYHQIGLLAEPERGSNGYRDYTVHDLIAVLRIRGLADLGIPLERVRALSTADPADADAALGALDAELAAQIEQLEARRRSIAALRREGAPLDVPPALARTATALTAERSPAAAAIDRELFLLLAHVSGRDDGLRALALLDRVAAAGSGALEVQLRFDALDADATEEERAALVDALVERHAPLLGTAVEAAGPALAPEIARLLDDYMLDRLNAAQRDVLRRLEACLAQLLEPPRDGRASSPAMP